MSAIADTNRSGRLTTSIQESLKARVDDLFRLSIGDLRRLARHVMHAYPLRQTVQPTGLVNQLYAELALQKNVPEDKAEFLRLCGLVMRRLIVRDLRRKFAEKRGGKSEVYQLDYTRIIEEREDLDLATVLSLDAALDRLAEDHPVVSAVVDLRFFSGLTIREAAEALGISPATVKRYWQHAVAFIREDLEASPHSLLCRKSVGLARSGGCAPDLAGDERASADGLAVDPDRQMLPFLERPIFRLLEEKETTLGPGERLGEYVIDQLVGVGGSSEVYLCHIEGKRAGRRYAVKLLREDRGYSEDFRRTFLREASIQPFEHPSLVRVISSGHASDRRPFLVMPFVEGTTLDVFCLKPGMNVARRLHLFGKLLEPLEFLHEANVVHCDLKPTNVLVSPSGMVHLLDFGAAQLSWNAPASERVVDQLSFVYASPERLRGEGPTPAADVYSLGVILLQVLTGRLLDAVRLDENARLGMWKRPNPKLAGMILKYEETLRAAGERRLSVAWRDAAQMRRESLRLSNLLGPPLENALARNPLQRLSLKSLKSCVAQAQRVCLQSSAPPDDD